MTPARLGTRQGVVTAVVVLAGALLLGGCGGPSDAAPLGPAARGAAPAAVTHAPPSLPPGDPGLDAPAVPDPGAAGARHPGREPARRTVPVAAMLTAGTVDMLLQGSWARRPGGGDECVRLEGAVASRVMSYGDAADGLVSETVGTYRDDSAAEAAVTAVENAAARCGWSGVTDPRLGSASVAASDGARSVVAVSADGVVVLLLGQGDVARDGVSWGSLVDLALGTSCAAARDGCH